MSGTVGSANGPLVSVRGEARESVQPDGARMSGRLVATRRDKQAALAAAAELTTRLTDDLASLGGVPLSVDTLRRPLVWSVHDAGTDDEWDPSGKTGRTGNVIAAVSVTITLRGFDDLERLTTVLAGHEALSMHVVSWFVDEDNEAWPRVRAAAITAAVVKARDYAAALGSRLIGVEHLADAGLLGGEDDSRLGRATALALHDGAAAMGGGGSPQLTPVPQELVAVVDGRFRASAVRLDDL